MKESGYITISKDSYNMMNDLLIERANHITDLRKEIKRLQEQLEIATKALKRIFYERDERAVGDYLWIANNALKEMENT